MYILVVEDDADVTKFLLTGLREAGHVVEHAGESRAALAAASTRHFDIMIIDRNLPGGIDGAGILSSLRENGITTPALFLSGRGQISDWVTGLQAGGDDYLVKPASMAEILARIESLRPRQPAGALVP
jgi:two-component system OmpR family response regulator